jgi:hypothetical protein
MNFLKKIPPYYVAKKTSNLINNGNIKLEDDYIFKGSNAYTKINELKQKNDIKFAYNELLKNVKKYQKNNINTF